MRRCSSRSHASTVVLVAIGVLFATSCGSDDSADDANARSGDAISAIASCYPLEEAARGVGGELVTVTNLTPPGQGPHDVELLPSQMGVTTSFLESIAPPALAETVAREVGAELDLLDPIEGLTTEQLDAGETSASIMRGNLQRLVTGLGCTS
jgi:ABC-type Zn uptake system ZnuABC Zn-binding protein ZnuA